MKSFVIFLLTAVLCPFPAAAEETKSTDVSPPQEQYLCLGRHMVPLMFSAKKYSELNDKSKVFCRKSIKWDRGKHWLCQVSEEVFLIDYPVDKVGIIPALFTYHSINFIDENLRCHEIETKCSERPLYFNRKYCWNKRSATEGYWESFAKNANQNAVNLDEGCDNTQSVTLYSRSIQTNCTDEACVLNSHKKTWMNVLELVEAGQDPDQLILDETDYTQVVSAKAGMLKEVVRPGVYCADIERDKKLKDIEPKITNHFTLKNSAKLVFAAPKDFPVMNIIRPTKKAPILEGYNCKSDADCYQGRGGTCMVEALAKNLPTVKDDSYSCKCQTGPVFYGCVPQKN